jgi:hypothetical protein
VGFCAHVRELQRGDELAKAFGAESFERSRCFVAAHQVNRVVYPGLHHCRRQRASERAIHAIEQEFHRSQVAVLCLLNKLAANALRVRFGEHAL